jgi:flagellar basal-body rod protein FlgB
MQAAPPRRLTFRPLLPGPARQDICAGDGILAAETRRRSFCGIWLWNSGCFRGSGMLSRLSDTLERYMDLLSARQKVVASNIANADTPGYKTRDIDFQSAFRSAASGGGAQSVEVAGLAVKNDGNNVSLDRESRLLAENDMRFNLTSNLLRSEVQSIRAALQAGSNT